MTIDELKKRLEDRKEHLLDKTGCCAAEKYNTLDAVEDWIDELGAHYGLLANVLERLAHIERAEMRAAHVFADESHRVYQARWACYMRVLTFMYEPEALRAEADRLGIKGSETT